MYYTILSHDQRNRLIDLLLHMPDADDKEWRDTLLRGLPKRLVNRLKRPSQPNLDLKKIVDTMSAYPSAHLSDGRCSILILIDNVLSDLDGAAIPDQLNELRSAAATRCKETYKPHRGGSPSPPDNPPDVTEPDPANPPGVTEPDLGSPPQETDPLLPADPLTDSQRRRVESALRTAFSNIADLESLVTRHLNGHLKEIISEENLVTAVRELVQWADSHSRIKDLIIGAVEVHSNNLCLRYVVRSLGWDGKTATNLTAVFYAKLGELIYEVEQFQQKIKTIETVFNGRNAIWPTTCDGQITNIQSIYRPIGEIQKWLINPSHIPLPMTQKWLLVQGSLASLELERNALIATIRKNRSNFYGNNEPTDRSSNNPRTKIQSAINTIESECESIIKSIDELAGVFQ